MPARAWRIQRTLELWIFLASPWHTLALPELAITFISKWAGKTTLFCRFSCSYNWLGMKDQIIHLLNTTNRCCSLAQPTLHLILALEKYQPRCVVHSTSAIICAIGSVSLFKTLLIKNPLHALISKSNIWNYARPIIKERVRRK